MSAEFVSAGAVSTSSGASTITVALPATVTSGNLLVIVAALSGRSFSSITNSYTQIVTSSSPTMWVGFKFAGASETAPVLTASGTMVSGSAVMVQYNGVTGTTFDVTGAVVTGSSITSLAATSVTTTATWDLLLTLFLGGATTSWTGPTSSTTRVASLQAAGSNGLFVADELIAAAGATGTRTVTMSPSGTMAGVLVAFKGSGAPPPKPENFFMFMT